jgi:hypothetical protein
MPFTVTFALMVLSSRPHLILVFFGQRSWNEEARMFCYQAESKPMDDAKDTPQCYTGRQSWGEKLSNRITPKMFLLNLVDGQIKPIECFETISPSSVRFKYPVQPANG